MDMFEEMRKGEEETTKDVIKTAKKINRDRKKMNKITNFEEVEEVFEEVIVWGFLGAILLFVLKIYFLGAILSAFVSGIMFSEYALKFKKSRLSSHKI